MSMEHAKAELTLIVGNLPRSLNRDQVQSWLATLGYGDSYDFLYVPRCFKTNCNKGYMFINFMQRDVGRKFTAALHGAPTGSGSTQFIVSLSVTQGIEAALAKLRKSSSRRIKNPQAWAYVRRGTDPESSTASCGNQTRATGEAARRQAPARGALRLPPGLQPGAPGDHFEVTAGAAGKHLKCPAAAGDHFEESTTASCDSTDPESFTASCGNRTRATGEAARRQALARGAVRPPPGLELGAPGDHFEGSSTASCDSTDPESFTASCGNRTRATGDASCRQALARGAVRPPPGLQLGAPGPASGVPMTILATPTAAPDLGRLWPPGLFSVGPPGAPPLRVSL